MGRITPESILLVNSKTWCERNGCSENLHFVVTCWVQHSLGKTMNVFSFIFYCLQQWLLEILIEINANRAKMASC